jgi:hypothetical protein
MPAHYARKLDAQQWAMQRWLESVREGEVGEVWNRSRPS